MLDHSLVQFRIAAQIECYCDPQAALHWGSSIAKDVIFDAGFFVGGSKRDRSPQHLTPASVFQVPRKSRLVTNRNLPRVLVGAA